MLLAFTRVYSGIYGVAGVGGKFELWILGVLHYCSTKIFTLDVSVILKETLHQRHIVHLQRLDAFFRAQNATGLDRSHAADGGGRQVGDVHPL